MRRSQKTYHTEPLLLKIHKAMIEDLKPKQSCWFSDPRNYTGPGYLYWKPYDYKVMRQLQHLFKRVLLTSDRSFDELANESFAGFVDNQKTFGLPKLNRSTQRVFERAREITHGILGEFDFDQFAKDCSFGRRAASGLPYRESYLDKRVLTLNGSPSQLEWFKAVLCTDIHLHRACRIGLKQFQCVDSLELRAVPKSFKSARIIAPDTTLGGFLSRGLGTLIRRRLEANTHIRLASQQDRHKELALRASIDGYLATIDMSKASDSFVWQHVCSLVPESWHTVLNVVRTPEVKVSGETTTLKSYMLMGSGHTFPLQTLLFYSIVKAVVELMGSRSKVDVYGDDIIFASQYSYYVVAVLRNLGFSINQDKSFFDGPFRESCGGDYHTGVDVRPFMPEHVCGKHTAYEYTEFLHKLINGLLSRWTYEEVPTACDLIYNEIVMLWGNLCPVPCSETDTSGVKFVPDKYQSLVRKPVYKYGIWTYLRLMRSPRRRKPNGERIYYWYSLRRDHEIPDLYGGNEGNSILDSKGREARKGSSQVRWRHST